MPRLTHPSWMELAVQRWDSLAEGVNPIPPEQVPGMPPRSQLVAEILEAMAASQEG